MADDQPKGTGSSSSEQNPGTGQNSPSERSRSQRLGDDAKRAGRRAGEALGTLSPYARPYPHSIHPALVPGIGIDEQRRRYSVDKVVFLVAGVLTVSFVIWGLTNPSNVSEVAGTAFTWTMENLGWLFNAVAIVVLVSLLVLAFTPYGRIVLGKDGEKPEFSTFAWVAMLFAAGIGIGVLFFGPSEPLDHFQEPAPLTAQPETVEALHRGMAQVYYHWGVHAWAMYALVGGAVAYAAYRRGRSLLMSSIFRTLFGKRHSEGFAGQLVDIFAIIATLFGTAAALGIAALQIGQGVTIVSGADEITNAVLAGIIAVLTIGFIISAVSGVARGIRYLSSINIVITVGLVGLVFFLGPTLFLLNMLPSALMEYFGSMFEMMGRSASWGAETLDYQSAQTIYYWAWWISWSPFVGIFIARISRGRSIRQFILGTILIPSSLLFVAYGVMGGASIWMYREGAEGFDDIESPEQVFFTVVENLPGMQWLPYVIILVLAIFFITSTDSASVVMGMLTSRGDQKPRSWVVVFWGLVMTGIAMVMLLLGDEQALRGLQSLVIVTAVPFAFIMLLIIVAWIRDLRTDPYALRHQFAEQAVSNAVVDGVDRYGDDFALQVVQTEPGEGAGAVVDSEHADYTEWYRRTDENGNPVGYDYETGQWADGWNPETGEIESVDLPEGAASGPPDSAESRSDSGRGTGDPGGEDPRGG